MVLFPQGAVARGLYKRQWAGDDCMSAGSGTSRNFLRCGADDTWWTGRVLHGTTCRVAPTEIGRKNANPRILELVAVGQKCNGGQAGVWVGSSLEDASELMDGSGGSFRGATRLAGVSSANARLTQRRGSERMIFRELGIQVCGSPARKQPALHLRRSTVGDSLYPLIHNCHQQSHLNNSSYTTRKTAT